MANVRLQGLQQLVAMSPDDATLPPRLARAHTVLGMIRARIGSFERAKADLEKAIEIYERLARQAPDVPEHRRHLCEAHYELGYLCWSDSRNEEARKHCTRVIELAEAALRDAPDSNDFRFLLARACQPLASSMTRKADEPARAQLYARAMEWYEPLVRADYRKVDGLAGLMEAAYKLAWIRWDGKDQAALVAALDKALVPGDEGLTLAPGSPQLLFYKIYTLSDKAEAVDRLGKRKEAMACQREAEVLARALVKADPDAVRSQLILADTLNRMVTLLTRRREFADAKAMREEVCQLMDGLAARAEDWQAFAGHAIRFRFLLTQFYQVNPMVSDPVQRQSEYLRALDAAVTDGRKLAERFAASPEVNSQFTQVLYRRALYEEEEAKRDAAALPLHEECVEVYRTRIVAPSASPEPWRVEEFLKATESAVQCAKRLERKDKVFYWAHLAHELGKSCPTREGRRSLGTMLSLAAGLYQQAGLLREAVQAYNDALAASKSAFEEAPWHWWLRQQVGGNYMHLVECHQARADSRNEVLAQREYLKVWLGPIQGMKIDPYVDPKNPTDEDEAVRLRKFVASSPGMKRFTVPCDFDGLKYPFHIYITETPWPKDPLEDQARWLLEERGGKVPEEVRESFRKLHKIAHDNNVSFQDLCVYALGTTTAENPDEDPNTASAPPGEKVDPVASLRAKVVDLKARADKTPSVSARLDLARGYHELGDACARAKRQTEAVPSFQAAQRLLEGLSRRSPADAGLRELLGRVYFSLGRVHAQLNSFESAYLLYRRHLDTFEGLLDESFQATWRQQVGEGQAALAELLQKDNPIEAARWAFRAVRQGHVSAARKLAQLFELDSNVRIVLPKDITELLKGSKGEAEKDKKVFADVFVREMMNWKVAAFRRDLERDPQSESGTGDALKLFETLIITGQPAEALKLMAELDRKGWKPGGAGETKRRNLALLCGFRAIAMHLTGGPPGNDLTMLREITAAPGYRSDWSWTEIDGWLQRATLESKAKIAVRLTVNDLKGVPRKTSK